MQTASQHALPQLRCSTEGGLNVSCVKVASSVQSRDSLDKDLTMFTEAPLQK